MAKAKKSKAREPISQNLTPKKAAFLAAFAVCGNVSEAAQAAGVSRETHYEWKRSDADYAKGFRVAQATANDALEAEARRRAIAGTQRLKFHEGSPILVPDPSGRMVPNYYAKMIFNEATGKHELPLTHAMVPYVEHQYSDTLLIFLLKAGRPKKFRENLKVEHSGEIKAPLTGENSQLPTREELLKRYLELAKKMPATGRGAK